MSIKYTPKKSRGTLQPGSYLAKVKTSVEAYSMKGDQMVELEVLVGPQGEMKFIEKLYNTEAAAWKMTQVRRSLGFSDETDGGEVDFEAADLVDCTGIVEIAFGKEVVEGKHKGKKFLEIIRWMPRGSVATGPELKDEIPMEFPKQSSIPF